MDEILIEEQLNILIEAHKNNIEEHKVAIKALEVLKRELVGEQENIEIGSEEKEEKEVEEGGEEEANEQGDSDLDEDTDFDDQDLNENVSDEEEWEDEPQEEETNEEDAPQEEVPQEEENLENVDMSIFEEKEEMVGRLEDMEVESADAVHDILGKLSNRISERKNS